jgi:hypothetical protein
VTERETVNALSVEKLKLLPLKFELNEVPAGIVSVVGFPDTLDTITSISALEAMLDDGVYPNDLARLTTDERLTALSKNISLTLKL